MWNSILLFVINDSICREKKNLHNTKCVCESRALFPSSNNNNWVSALDKTAWFSKLNTELYSVIDIFHPVTLWCNCEQKIAFLIDWIKNEYLIKGIFQLTIIWQWQNTTVQMALTCSLWESCNSNDWAFWLVFGNQMSRTSGCCNNWNNSNKQKQFN